MMTADRVTTNRRVRIMRTGALFLGLFAAAASGQSGSDTLTAVRACSSIENDADRLACLDAALGSSDVPVETRADPVVTSVTDTNKSNHVTQSNIDATEQDVPAGERAVRIVEIRRSGLGVTTYVAEDGQAWVNRTGTQGRFPPVPFEAILRPALGDSFFLVSPLGGPRTRVQPLR